MSWNFVQAWTKSPSQDCAKDDRGWKKGLSRTHSQDLPSRIVQLRKELADDPEEFYVGNLAIQQKYQLRFPDDPPPSLTRIGTILREAGLSEPHRKKRRGTARYLCYPTVCVDRIGKRIAEIDFVGAKFIAGSSVPLHFLSVAYKNPARLRCIKRTIGETTDEAVEATRGIFNELGWPDAVRLDAGNPFTGRGERMDGKGTGSIPRFAAFLLDNKLVPVFGAIRSPWNQAHVEGSNSVFGRNFWNRHDFTSIEDVDQKLAAFNDCSKRYAEWTPWDRKVSSFVPRICFIRKGEEDTRKKEAWIPVASERIELPHSFIGLFVFAEWNLHRERLRIFLEQERQISLVKELSFPIHPSSLKRCSHFIR